MSKKVFGILILAILAVGLFVPVAMAGQQAPGRETAGETPVDNSASSGNQGNNGVGDNAVGVDESSGSEYELDFNLDNSALKGVGDSLDNIIKAFAGLAGFAAVGAIVFLGFRMMMTTDEQAIAETKKQLAMVLAGFAVVLMSYMIVDFFARCLAGA